MNYMIFMNKNIFKDQSILVTGGTGSFGKCFIGTVIKKFSPKKLVVLSRDELKQYKLSQEINEKKYPCIRYFLGDVRDKDRINRAFSGIDIVIHAAAMKHVPAAEYNPTECIATNILGAQNIIDAAISNNVKLVLALSTDKAANPINLYGASKLCSDKLFIAANNLAGKHKTRFSIVRYGNVIGSRGSVIPYFKELIARGQKKLPLTHQNMTRFIISLQDGVNFVINRLIDMKGGEIFVPKIRSLRIIDLIEVMAGKGNFDVVGTRPGEKLHEVMIPKEESFNCIELEDFYVIPPTFSWWNKKELEKNLIKSGKIVNKEYEFNSGNKDLLLSKKEIKDLLM